VPDTPEAFQYRQQNKNSERNAAPDGVASKFPHDNPEPKPSISAGVPQAYGRKVPHTVIYSCLDQQIRMG